MADIQNILIEHSFEVQGLLRKHKIPGPIDVDTISKAYKLKGEHFMMELLKIITPTSNFSPLSEAYTSAAEEPQATGKFWSFWDKLLSTATKTAEVIGQAKNDINNPVVGAAGMGTANAQPAANNQLLYWVAGGFIALIIIILIVRR